MTDGGVDDATAALVRAISAGHLRTARALGAGHASMAELDLTPLTHAIIFGGVDDVAACLDAGADLEQRDFWSRTPWMLAVLTGDIEMAATLRGRGADVGARTHIGMSALHYAAEEGLAHMLEWLITNGADIEETSD